MIRLRRRSARASLPWPLPRWNTLHLRLYGAADLGMRASSGDADDLPRTKHVGGELFVGVDVLGGRRTTVTRAQDRAWYEQSDVRFPALTRDAAWRAPYGAEERHGGHCEISDEEQAAAFLVNRDHTARVIARLDKRGDTVVIALTATSVIVTGSHDEDGMRFILDRARQLIDGGADILSVHPLVWRNGQWLPFDWSGDFPQLAERIDAVVRRAGALHYAAQVPALARRGVVVPEAELVEHPGGAVTTRAVWRRGTRALLPVVDEIVVEDTRGSATVMPMAEFLERAGLDATRTDAAPARYAVARSASV